MSKFMKCFVNILKQKKLFRLIDDHSTIELRYKHRMKIFKQVNFVKKFEFSEYES